MKLEKQRLREITIQRGMERHAHTPVQRLLLKTAHSNQQEVLEILELEKQLSNLIYDLLKPEYGGQSVNPELLKEARRKRKQHKPSW
jgi:hypothetical protein